jgi:hypothetical protein
MDFVNFTLRAFSLVVLQKRFTPCDAQTQMSVGFLMRMLEFFELFLDNRDLLRHMLVAYLIFSF